MTSLLSLRGSVLHKQAKEELPHLVNMHGQIGQQFKNNISQCSFEANLGTYPKRHREGSEIFAPKGQQETMCS